MLLNVTHLCLQPFMDYSSECRSNLEYTPDVYAQFCDGAASKELTMQQWVEEEGSFMFGVNSHGSSLTDFPSLEARGTPNSRPPPSNLVGVQVSTHLLRSMKDVHA